jgi:SAM-dependent methyltransferase
MHHELLADPVDRAPLRAHGPVLRNDAGLWPVLGGIPFLVLDPSRWLAGRRTHTLAALAEAGRLRPEDVAALDDFASAVRAAPHDVPDDFLDDEELPVDVIEGPSADVVRALLASRGTLVDWLASRCGSGPVLEIGAGAGALTRRLTGRPLVVVDHSVRALLRATAGTDAIPVVGDATALPVAPEAFGTVVAANVLDVIDDPVAAVDEIAASLAPGGRLVCCSPDPALGARGGPEEALVDVLEAAGLRIVEDVDGLPWLRVHGARELQVFVVRALVAER